MDYESIIEQEIYKMKREVRRYVCDKTFDHEEIVDLLTKLEVSLRVSFRLAALKELVENKP